MAKITTESKIDPELGDIWWAEYDRTFAPLNAVSPCRQSFYRDEFMAALQDEKVVKIVLWENGEMISLGMWGPVDRARFPWLSEDYFKNHPIMGDLFDRRVLFYFIALLTLPEHQASGKATVLFEPMVSYVASRDGYAIFDVCEQNSWLPEFVYTQAKNYCLCVYEQFGVQTYVGVGGTMSEEVQAARLGA